MNSNKAEAVTSVLGTSISKLNHTWLLGLVGRRWDATQGLEFFWPRLDGYCGEEPSSRSHFFPAPRTPLPYWRPCSSKPTPQPHCQGLTPQTSSEIALAEREELREKEITVDTVRSVC